MNYRKLITMLSCYPNTTNFDWTVFSYGTNYYAKVKCNDNWIVSYNPTSITLCLLDLLDKLLLQEEI